MMTLVTALSPEAVAALFDASADYFVVLRPSGDLVAANHACRRELLPPALDLPASLAETLSAPDVGRLRRALAHARQEGSATVALNHVAAAGGTVSVQYGFFVSPDDADLLFGVGRPFKSDRPLVSRLEELGRRLSEMNGQVETLQQRLAEQAAVDALTTLPTRREFERLMANEWHRAARLGLGMVLFAIDVDALRTVNDRSGPEAGDRVLQSVASFLRTNSRPYDVVARLEDDLFVLLTVHRPADDYRPEEHARRLCESFEATPVHFGSGGRVRVCLSVGVATALPASDTRSEPGSLLQAARDALSKAKQAAGRRVYMAT